MNYISIAIEFARGSRRINIAANLLSNFFVS